MPSLIIWLTVFLCGCPRLLKSLLLIGTRYVSILSRSCQHSCSILCLIMETSQSSFTETFHEQSMCCSKNIPLYIAVIVTHKIALWQWGDNFHSSQKSFILLVKILLSNFAFQASISQTFLLFRFVSVILKFSCCALHLINLLFYLTCDYLNYFHKC